MSSNKGLMIIGAGGHSKVVLSVALSNAESIYGYLDDKPTLLNTTIGQYPVLGDTTLLNCRSEYAVFGIGKNLLRKKIVDQYPGFTRWKTLIHPHAYVHPSVKLGKGTVVFAGAVIQPDVVIGDHCIINTGATIDHDCIIGDYAHLAPGVNVAGGVTIGEGSFLGIGSAIIPMIKIAEWVQVAAGGVVVKNISAYQQVMGVPARERI